MNQINISIFQIKKKGFLPFTKSQKKVNNWQDLALKTLFEEVLAGKIDVLKKLSARKPVRQKNA
ncbi:hypothetical protein GCM10027275_08910 [Rhabdobacter roseus]|uniref:Uncharacterized protein n=1 Tax=Rhabdobacter roseus TaxID=1655419 RepID=A0A840THP0_9BACT|nr:hypothetical protein [Rhabdobacter roseus]